MKTYNFPNDIESLGGFQTKLVFTSWAQGGTIKLASGECGNETLVKVPELMILLPMPEQLGTGYRGLFDDVEGIDLMRDKIDAQGSFVGSMKNAGRGLAYSGATQITKLMNATVLGSSTGAMGQTKILNNKAGVEYKGAVLREHTFSWKLSPRSIDEQQAIHQIVTAIKSASTPGKMQLGKDGVEDFINNSNAALKGAAEAVGAEEGGTTEGVIDMSTDEISAAMATITTLSIPPTVNVEFLRDGYKNSQLFKVSDSFITSFDVNYTPNGNWQAHMDGSAIETTITVTLKEVEPLTNKMIGMGY